MNLPYLCGYFLGDKSGSNYLAMTYFLSHIDTVDWDLAQRLNANFGGDLYELSSSRTFHLSLSQTLLNKVHNLQSSFSCYYEYYKSLLEDEKDSFLLGLFDAIGDVKPFKGSSKIVFTCNDDESLLIVSSYLVEFNIKYLLKKVGTKYSVSVCNQEDVQGLFVRLYSKNKVFSRKNYEKLMKTRYSIHTYTFKDVKYLSKKHLLNCTNISSSMFYYWMKKGIITKS